MMGFAIDKKFLSLISLIYFCFVLLILAQVTHKASPVHCIYTYIWRHIQSSLIASSLSEGLTTTDYNMLFSSTLQGLCLHISSPFMTYRTPVSQNLSDMVVPTTAKTFNPFIPRSSSFVGPAYSYM